MRRNKILQAAEQCLNAAECGYGEYPFVRMRAFLYGLRADPNWSDADVLDVQMRVIQILVSLNAKKLANWSSNTTNPVLQEAVNSKRTPHEDTTATSTAAASNPEREGSALADHLGVLTV